jgi:hypothetical protein
LQPRPLVDNGDGTHTIPLTRGQVAIISSEDAVLAGTRNWYATPVGCRLYAVTNGSGGERIYLHRLLMGCPADEVDHANGDSLDNRRVNLRLATHAENNRNKGLQKNNTSGYKGVSLRSDTGRWAAYIMAGGKRRSLGCFDTPEAARDAYVAAAIELHKEFAKWA